MPMIYTIDPGVGVFPGTTYSGYETKSRSIIGIDDRLFVIPDWPYGVYKVTHMKWNVRSFDHIRPVHNCPGICTDYRWVTLYGDQDYDGFLVHHGFLTEITYG